MVEFGAHPVRLHDILRPQPQGAVARQELRMLRLERVRAEEDTGDFGE